MNDHRLVTLHFGPNALTGRCACGVAIIAPRAMVTISRALDNHRSKRGEPVSARTPETPRG